MEKLSAHPYPNGQGRADPYGGYEGMDTAPLRDDRADTPDSKVLAAQAMLISPTRQHQLGRMSVAPVRYSLPTSALPPVDVVMAGAGGTGESLVDPFGNPVPGTGRADGTRSGANPYRNPDLGWAPAPPIPIQATASSDKNAFGEFIDKIRHSTIGTSYRAYRPFIWPVMSLTAAMCLSLAMQGPGGGGGEWGTIVEVADGGFDVMPSEAGGKGVGLGLWGWCALNKEESTCYPYRTGDFISTSPRYRIPSDDTSSILDNFANLLTALTALAYFLSAYHIVAGFLHFFLLFGLSIPFNQLHSGDPLPPLTAFTQVQPYSRSRKRSKIKLGPNARDILQAEVDLRARCERPPYEAYHWVWWAWWAHRRSPVGEVFALIVGLLGICTIGMAVRFHGQVTDAAAADTVTFGAGTFVALLAFVLNLDAFISSIRSLCSPRVRWFTFLHPPQPSVAPLTLPNGGPRKRLGAGNGHLRNVSGGSFFVLPRGKSLNLPLPPPSASGAAARASQASRAALRSAYIGSGPASAQPLAHGAAGYGPNDPPAVAPRMEGRGSMFYDPDAPPMPVLPTPIPAGGVGREGGGGEWLFDAPQTAMFSATAGQIDPTMGLDDETTRWLAAYPSDPDLVPLIARLRQGPNGAGGGEKEQEDEFILSDVGLLYLRPDFAPGTDREIEDALLVPPRGTIRLEILEDTHFAIIDEDPFDSATGTGPATEFKSKGTAAHWEAEEMVRQIGETFWWPSMHTDAVEYVAKCAGCQGGGTAREWKGLLQ